MLSERKLTCFALCAQIGLSLFTAVGCVTAAGVTAAMPVLRALTSVEDQPVASNDEEA